jgi:hypothetical protein
VGGTGRRGGGCSGRWHVNFAASGAMATCAGRRRLQGDGAIIAPHPHWEVDASGRRNARSRHHVARATWELRRRRRVNGDAVQSGQRFLRGPDEPTATGEPRERRQRRPAADWWGRRAFWVVGLFLTCFFGPFQ